MTPDERARAAGIDLLDYNAPPSLARSALGFVSLPVGFAVEVEGIFEVIGAA